MNVRTTGTLVVVGSIAVISFLIKSERRDTAEDRRTDLPEGYYLEGVELTGTDAMGDVLFVLRAGRVDHRPSDDSIELDDIALEYGGPEASWTMRAERGRMPQSNDEIDLVGNVRIENERLNESGPTLIRSESLHVDIAAQTASTVDPVRISVGRGSLQGVGLQVDFANERVNILSDISGVFDPPPR